jgi:hypothetical protein
VIAWPKPEKPIRGGSEAKAYMEKVAELPCSCCGLQPVVLHHPIMGRFAQRKATDFDVIPLCPAHHDELHADVTAWREKYGEDTLYIVLTRAYVLMP